MSTVEKISINLSKESKERKESDNNLEIKISNESVTRVEEDVNNRIKIANESANRAESDASLSVKLSDEVKIRVQEIESLKRRIEVLEQIVGSVDEPKDDKTVSDKLMISQEMFVRQLNMLKRSGKFILDNAKPTVIAEDKDESFDFLVHLNNLQLTFDNLLTNQNKYTLTDETKKCIKEAEELKIKLDELANKNWDVEAIVNNRQSGRGAGC